MKTFTLRNNTHITLAAAVVCLAAVTAGARADEVNADVPARTVRFADLDLTTQKGAAVLFTRIRNAAEEVCGEPGSRELAQVVAAKACVDRAIARSVAAVNNAKLSGEYDAHMGAAQKRIHVAGLD